jgi:hypothetical protein
MAIALPVRGDDVGLEVDGTALTVGDGVDVGVGTTGLAGADDRPGDAAGPGAIPARAISRTATTRIARRTVAN